MKKNYLLINYKCTWERVKYFQYAKKVTTTIDGVKTKYYQSQISLDINDVPIEPNKIITVVFKDGTQGLTQFDIKKGEWGPVSHFRLINQDELPIPKKFPDQGKMPYIYGDDTYIMVIK